MFKSVSSRVLKKFYPDLYKKLHFKAASSFYLKLKDTITSEDKRASKFKRNAVSNFRGTTKGSYLLFDLKELFLGRMFKKSKSQLPSEKLNFDVS